MMRLRGDDMTYRTTRGCYYDDASVRCHCCNHLLYRPSERVKWPIKHAPGRMLLLLATAVGRDVTAAADADETAVY